MTVAPLAPLRDPLGDRVPERVAQEVVHQAQAELGLLRPEFPPIETRPLTSIRGEPPPRVVLGFGLGCDSSAILGRWLTDPSSRDFELHDLAVITGMTGQEWPVTRHLVEEHLLPRMAAAGVRYLQVARRGPRQADGVDILSDTRRPDRLHLVGAWTLAHEMFDSATVPQTTGDRLCSLLCTKQEDTPGWSVQMLKEPAVSPLASGTSVVPDGRTTSCNAESRMGKA